MYYLVGTQSHIISRRPSSQKILFFIFLCKSHVIEENVNHKNLEIHPPFVGEVMHLFSCHIVKPQ